MLNFQQRKESLAQSVVLLRKRKCASLSDAALLDIVCTHVHRHYKIRDVYQMSKGPGADLDLCDLEQFKSSFTNILQKANVQK